MNPNSSKDRQRLSNAVSYWYRESEHHRRGRAKLIREYAGTGYGRRLVFGMSPEIYVNLIQQTVEAYSAAYAFNDPQFDLTTFHQAHKQFAEKFEVAINNYSRRILLRNTIEECIQDAFFCMGICKIYLEDAAEVYAEMDPTMDPGMPWAGRVSYDNFVYDGTAECMRRCQFIGDRFRMNLDDAKANPAFSPTQAKKLEYSPYVSRHHDGSSARQITEGSTNPTGEMADGVDLINIFLSREQLICTWPIDENFNIPDTAPLATMDWDGPDTGPYRFLSFLKVPDNVMPTAPGQALRPLFLLFNNLMRKLSSRARAQKDVPFFTPGSEDDMQRALSTQDMQPIAVNDKDGISVLKLGGIDQSISSFNYGVFEMFKTAAGNLDYMAGLGPSSGTLGQDQLIAQQANSRVALNRQRVNEFAADIARDIAWLMFDDPVLVVPGSKRVEETEYQIDASWYPPHIQPREGRFEDYGIKIDPLSMQYVSPQEKLMKLRQTVQMLAPMHEQFAASGVQFDPQAYILLESKLQQFPEIMEVYKTVTPTVTNREGSGGGMGGQNPTGVPREYIRKSVSQGPTNNGSMNQAFTQQPHNNGQQTPTVSG